MAKKVLIVDDSRTVRQQLGVVLTEAGYEVVEASDGLDGAEKIAQTSDLAMVICDVNMPRMNGIEMLTFLKQDPRHANLLVLMLTTEGQPALIARAKAAGARGWIVKPFKPDLLLGTVRKLVGAA
ncbi:MAG TPA: response regulator [Polyangiaceae bacterium]|jgi:two-component system chemotaxis response regulator CheY|nr:response regulator [Polyangiaceae bacterium]